MRSKLKDQRGMSLIELLVANAILAIIIASIFSVLMAGVKSLNTVSQNGDIQQIAQMAMNKTVSALRNAIQIDTDHTNNNQIVFYPDDNSTVRIILESNILYWEDWSGATSDFSKINKRYDRLEMASDITGLEVIAQKDYIEFAFLYQYGDKTNKISNAVLLAKAN